MNIRAKGYRLILLSLTLASAAGAPLSALGENPMLPGSAANLPGAMPSRPTASSAAGATGGKTTERLREGTKLIDVVGTFQSIGGDSVSFTPGPAGSNKESLRVLENLALQRVGQALDENKGARLWTVTGEITEYKGANYLLLKKTVIHPQEGDAAGGQ